MESLGPTAVKVLGVQLFYATYTPFKTFAKKHGIVLENRKESIRKSQTSEQYLTIFFLYLVAVANAQVSSGAPCHNSLSLLSSL